jgi:hypothetical protein
MLLRLEVWGREPEPMLLRLEVWGSRSPAPHQELPSARIA